MAPNGAQTVAAQPIWHRAHSTRTRRHLRERHGAGPRAVRPSRRPPTTKVVGQTRLRTSLLVTLLAEGHILVESVPGLAKTTAAATLAGIVNASFARIQCTPDLLPSDIVGTQVYDPHTATFDTRLGPVHANFVLLDEINRSSAKTQSAMLEAMQERQTSIGGVMYPLPRRSWCSPRRTRSRRRAPTSCPRRSSTASSSRT